MYIIGTAGHVDHGKSSLVEALTGINPDRLKEEKERKLTIDLGFAWLKTSSGKEISIIDVPGHVRFIKNMLAGVGGIDIALLIVAADESVMNQTREHIDILDLLQIKQIIPVITKIDLVKQDWLDLVIRDVESLLKTTNLSCAPIIRVSAKTRERLPELKHTIEQSLIATEPKKDLGRPRLYIDRSFIMAGFGTVVTGTLTDGKLKVGQNVELVNSGIETRIRGIQSHKKTTEMALPGSRVAVNITNISPKDIQRGEVLTIPGWLTRSEAIDVRLTISSNIPRPVKHNNQVTLHIGSNETTAKIRLLIKDRIEPGGYGWAQLKLTNPLPIVRGDFFVIRSDQRTLGGGTVLVTFAKRHKRNNINTINQLKVINTQTTNEIILQSLDTLKPLSIKNITQNTNIETLELETSIKELTSAGKIVTFGDWENIDAMLLISKIAWDKISSAIENYIQEYHTKFNLRIGIGREELRNRLGYSKLIFSKFIDRMTINAIITEVGAYIKLSTHTPKPNDIQERQISEYIKNIEASPFSPPTNLKLDIELLNLLVNQGRIVKMKENIIFSSHSYNTMLNTIVKYTETNGTITVAQVRDIFKTSRKYAVAFLEYLDENKITRRIGDERILRKLK